MYSRISISRTRISRILRNSKHLSESKIHFDCFLQLKVGVGYLFTSPNYPKCKMICTSGDLNSKNSPINFEVSRFDCTLLLICELFSASANMQKARRLIRNCSVFSVIRRVFPYDVLIISFHFVKHFMTT